MALAVPTASASSRRAVTVNAGERLRLELEVHPHLAVHFGLDVATVEERAKPHPDAGDRHGSALREQDEIEEVGEAT